MRTDTNQENRVLTHLVDINQDACDFYSEASKRAESPEISHNFRELESLHQSVVSDLSRCIRENGGDPDADGTFTGKTVQFFGTLMSKLSSDVDETLVNYLEEAEDRCLHSMQDAIDEQKIRPHTKALLVGELSTLQRTHDHMKSLKDSMSV